MSASASASVVASASASAVAQFAVSSPRIADGGRIPVEFTCDGGQMSPPLEWTGVPSGTGTLALIVDDPDANGYVHWVAYGIEPGSNLAQGISRAPGAPMEGLNSRGTVGWTGPCPPSGTHHYDFTLYALSRAVSFDQRPTAAQLRAAMKGAIIARSRLVATYRRG
jgi:Raf kinase inhibitor-like YbhB/YbcL family protein